MCAHRGRNVFVSKVLFVVAVYGRDQTVIVLRAIARISFNPAFKLLLMKKQLNFLAFKTLLWYIRKDWPLAWTAAS